MRIEQRIITLSPKPRGFHLVTREIEAELEELSSFRTALSHLQLLHTSASLSLNENADPDVRRDMEVLVRRLVPDGAPGLFHTLEGEDDMSAHVKSSLFGSSLSVPIRDGEFLLGTWQGIYLGEHRESGGGRHIAVTIIGE